jgi:hypothetical protein
VNAGVSSYARERILQWANELIDLTRRSPSLQTRTHDPSARRKVRSSLGPVAPGPLEILELLERGRLDFHLPPPADGERRAGPPSDDRLLVTDRDDRGDVEATLRALARQAGPPDPGCRRHPAPRRPRGARRQELRHGRATRLRQSQTIANMVAELVAAGRSVLFVSEKVPALEVVANRLRDCGLDHLLFELHSEKATRKEVAAALGHALDNVPVARTRLGSADLEHARQLRVRLSGYAEAANRVREPLGRTVHWVLGRLSQLTGAPSLPPPDGIDERLDRDQLIELSPCWTCARGRPGSRRCRSAGTTAAGTSP